ncbi:MAG: MbcA/ParS/Xre antitoxin family protein [Thiohalomonadaceae bacterium]
MNTALALKNDKRAVLTKSLLRAGQGLGLDQAALARVIGMERSVFRRGVEPASKAGELGLLLIRCYRSLFALMGGDPEHMRHWMHTPNRHTGGVPAAQVQTVEGLVHVLSYLDAIRGKV